MRLAVTVLGLLFASACQHLDADGDEPALLIDSSDAVRAELRAALAEALGTAPALADDVFVRSSMLVIERAALSSGTALTGRTLGSGAERFTLVLAGGRCVLVRASDAWRKPLDSARCLPE